MLSRECVCVFVEHTARYARYVTTDTSPPVNAPVLRRPMIGVKELPKMEFMKQRKYHEPFKGQEVNGRRIR